MTNKKPSIGILGAGISGLAIAYKLSSKNCPVTVYEKESEVGGAIKTHHENGWLVEKGPNTLMAKSKEIWELLEDLDLMDKSIEAGKTAKKRFIIKNGQPIPLPMSLGSFLKTDLLSISGKFRLLKEPFAATSNTDDESIAQFISRRLGQEPLDYAINPFVSGIYAGDPKTLSIKHTFGSLWEMEQQHGSLFKGMLKKSRNGEKPKRALISFEQGLQQLPLAIADRLGTAVQTGTEIQTVQQHDGQWIVKAQKDGESIHEKHDLIVSTLPVHALGNIFDNLQFNSISDLPYAPLSVVALGFSSDQITHPLDGFGMLIPEVEQYQTLGTLFSSSLFPGRTPDGHVLLTSFIGGARNPELASKGPNTLQSIVLKDVQKLLDISGNPVFTHHQHWPATIPQYTVGYDKYLSAIDQIEKQHPGLFIHGNFRGGVSIPDCITSGFSIARSIVKEVEQT
ncbi:protoporphyrinogen oxidase [Fodinibius sp. Rm-B-1B1-1]|uniref:protoporphyrinogen oxidase n=1 Tax=Fodinibius alkaliphilus TaxID=3140241 RepID=UPI00315B0E97